MGRHATTGRRIGAQRVMVQAMLPLLATAWIACDRPAEAPVHQLVRASMALRGVRPSPGEIAALQADPGQLEALVTGWLDDPRFGETVRDMHAEQFLLRIDSRDHLEPLGPLAGWTQAEITASLDEEPLRLIERIVTEGRPYTEIVTADRAVADPVTAAAHGALRDPGEGWVEADWGDDRPLAGILSSTSLWQRHMSSNVNHHRTRAHFVLSDLLCQDFPAGNVQSRVETGDALTDDPTCGACHQTLDPLASAFYGFRDYVLPADNALAEGRGCPPDGAWACTPLGMWDDALQADREAENMPPAALFGQPVADLADLGRQIAAQPAFARCTARRFASWLGQLPEERVPDAEVDRLTDVLEASGFDARAVVLDVVLDPAFAREDGWAGPLRARPEQLARLVEDLTGFRWTSDVPGYGTVDVLGSDAYGDRVLAGGIDGWSSVRPVLAPTASRELVLEELARRAADHAVDSGRWPPGGVTTHPAQVRRALAQMALAATGEPDFDVSGLQALFDGALARSGDPAHAWKVAATALLLDPDTERY
ncbi:MAG: DUF1585 domain-containing protein [Myxococcota bacterium]